MTSLSPSQIEALHLCSQITSAISIIASLLVVGIHFCFRAPKRRFDDPVLWLAVTSFVAPFFTLGIHKLGGPWFCWIEAVGNQFFFLSSFVWVTCIGHQIYAIVVQNVSIEDSRFMKAYHTIAWGSPFFSVLVLSFFGEFESVKPHTSDWCWVSSGFWRIISFYVPLLLMLAINLIIYTNLTLNVYRTYREALGVSSYGQLAPANGRVQTTPAMFAWKAAVWGLEASLYLIVFFITRVGSIINRLHEEMSKQEPLYGLRIFHNISVGLSGFLYACVYIYNERVLSRLIAVIRGRADRRANDNLPTQDDIADLPSDEEYENNFF